MLDFLKNLTVNLNRYKTHSEAVIISCFYNPQNNPYRLIAFQKFYRSIKHLNHQIIECLIGDAEKQLPDSPHITTVHTDSLLWHKESLLNKVIGELPEKYKYVFWIDADVIFTNQNWLVDSVKQLQKCNIVQPFEYCVHLNRNKLVPEFNVDVEKFLVDNPELRQERMWRSFCANCVDNKNSAESKDYNIHGHVGFAWGARREILEKCPLYDEALIGGADHVMAHAAIGQIPHNCITKAFTDNINEITAWQKEFYNVVKGKVGYAKGNLYHIWHGDTNRRQYLKRIQDSTKHLKNLEKDKNGLHVKTTKNGYMKKYFAHREVDSIVEDFDFYQFYDEYQFLDDMGYAVDELVEYFGQPTYSMEEEEEQQEVPQEIYYESNSEDNDSEATYEVTPEVTPEETNEDNSDGIIPEVTPEETNEDNSDGIIPEVTPEEDGFENGEDFDPDFSSKENFS